MRTGCGAHVRGGKFLSPDYTNAHMFGSTSSHSPIVLAESGDALRQLKTMLHGTWPLKPVASVDEAKLAITPATPAVLCGCHFDEGGVYDLLRWLRAQPALSQVPFLTTRVLEGELDDAMYESVKIATAALGGNGFVDLRRWEQRHGPQEAARLFAERVKALALGAPTDFDSRR